MYYGLIDFWDDAYFLTALFFSIFKEMHLSDLNKAFDRHFQEIAW